MHDLAVGADRSDRSGSTGAATAAVAARRRSPTARRRSPAATTIVIIDKRELTGEGAVLNGIAYDAATDRLFVTGKLWPKLFEIKIVPR